ncbi:hypothetical protein [Gilvibacter sp.]|uniref:hypothetical protein n=1 Tax=Gilvibacter sp. TaxID=2729997 RepID=UPI003F4A1F05
MKKEIRILLFMLVVSIGGIQAQTYADETNTAQQQEVLSQTQQQSTEVAIAAQSSNTVFIDQIGENNNVRIDNSALQSNFAITQIGQDNIVNLQLRADLINQQVVQRGTNHLVNDFSLNSRVHNLTIVQEGESQNFVFHGGNSITEDMKVSMQGQNQSIIVRSFN